MQLGNIVKNREALMPTKMVNGCTIHYEEMGTGIPIFCTPGGRNPREIMRPVAERLAPGYRTVIYDRRNCTP